MDTAVDDCGQDVYGQHYAIGQYDAHYVNTAPDSDARAGINTMTK